MEDALWKSLLAEFFGTLILMFVGLSALAITFAQGGSIVSYAFAFGLAFMSLIYALGSYSGAHFNPAVSFGYACAGRMNWLLMIGYWIAQILGAFAAAGLVLWFFGSGTDTWGSVGSLTNTEVWKSFILEAIITFILVFVILLVTRNPIFSVAGGLAIGLVLTFNTFAAFTLTGASMNPARSLATSSLTGNIGTYWVYAFGPLLGALVAAIIFRIMNKKWGCCKKVDDCGNVVTDACGNPITVCKRPMLDNCGKCITDCNGKVYETYETVEHKLNHMQQTWPMAIGGWMTEHGLAPQYVGNEISKVIHEEKLSVDSVVNSTNMSALPQLPASGLF